MTLWRMSASLTALIAALSALLAGATIWLLLTDPTTIASALQQGDVSPIAGALADLLIDACRAMLRWL
jgi:hypothetical protein